MGPHRRLDIYVWYESSTIIRNLEPSTDDLFTHILGIFHFDEVLSSLGAEDKDQFFKERLELSWSVPLYLIMIPPYFPRDSEVQGILNIMNVANSMRDEFGNIAEVIRYYIPAANML